MAKPQVKRRESARPRLQLTGLTLAAGWLLCVATLCGFLASLAWQLDLFAHFRVQYFLGLGLSAAVAALSRQWKSAACFALLAAVNLATILPLYFGGSPQTPHSPPLRALLLNVNTRFGDVDRVAEVLRRFDADLVVLQEVDSRWITQLETATGGYAYSKMAPRNDNFGIALYSKLPLRDARIVYLGDAGLPSLIAELQTGDRSFRLVATHPLPPASRDGARLRNDQLTQLAERVRSAEAPVLLLGDLNVSPWSPYFRDLLRRSGLRDSARGFGLQPTWPAHLPLLLIPIDHCLHAPEIRILRRQIGPYVESDHYPLIVDFALW